MPTARERQEPHKSRRGIVSDTGLAERQLIASPATLRQQCEFYSDIVNRHSGDVDLIRRQATQIRACSLATQCAFCRWRHRSAGSAADPASTRADQPGMDSEDQWCGRLIRDQHGVYGKLTPVFREHFNNRRKNSTTSSGEEDLATTTILHGGDAREVAMETSAEGVGSTSSGANEQQRNLILAAQLSGLSLAERRLAVAPRITLTSFDGDCSDDGCSNGSGRQQRSAGAGSSSDAETGPCLSAGLGGSPLSPNFLAVPQLQEVGKERRPAPMVV